MSHFYEHEELPLSFDANAMVNLRVKEAGAIGEQLFRTYMNGYEKFWQTPRTHGDRAMSMTDAQAMIDAAPAVMNDMIADGTAFITFVQASHASKVGTEFFPTRYLTIPYETDVDGRLVSLKSEWEAQE